MVPYYSHKQVNYVIGPPTNFFLEDDETMVSNSDNEDEILEWCSSAKRGFFPRLNVSRLGFPKDFQMISKSGIEAGGRRGESKDESLRGEAGE